MTTQAEEPLSREDRFVTNKKRLLIAYVAAFGVWQLAELMREASAGAVREHLKVVSLGAWVAWLVLLLLATRNDARVRRDPALRAALQDERAQAIRLRSYRIGFWVAVGSAAILGIPAASNLLPAYVVAKLVIVPALAAFLVSTVVLDRD
jgi:uncharacterized membrane protein